MIDEELERDVRDFLRAMANECKTCLRRNQGYCDTCYARRAERILERMSRDSSTESPAVRCDIVARMARIAAVMKRANRPVMSQEIYMRDLCSRSLKEWTLREMIRLGKVKRQRIRGSGKYLYSLSTIKPQKERNRNGR